MGEKYSDSGSLCFASFKTFNVIQREEKLHIQ